MTITLSLKLSQMTPSTIWQTWKTKKMEDVPPHLKTYIEKWKRLHPRYAYHLLDDDDLREIVKEVVPQHLELYDSFTHVIERVDFARYAIMYKYGGVYADLDTTPLQNIDIWVNKNQIILGCEPQEHAQQLYDRDRVLCNALMISPPGKSFWLALMRYIAENYEHRYRPVENTGPLAITKFLEEHPHYEENLVITDPCVFFPIKDDGNVSERCDLNKSYVAHVWNNSWTRRWYQDPIVFNARYWSCTLLVIFFVSWTFIFAQRRNQR